MQCNSSKPRLCVAGPFQKPHAFLILILLAASVASGVAAADPSNTKNRPAKRIAREQPAKGPFVKTHRGYMIPYAASIPGTAITFEMIPVPGQKPARREDAKEVASVKPFWIGKYEVTWREYAEYMKLYDVFRTLESKKQRIVDDANRIDAVTAPTEVYEPFMRFEFALGPRSPAATMSRYAARQYTKWLSKLSGRQYRLPTEREWEHACRGGTTTPWSFGADSKVAGDFCVFDKNARDNGPRLVGSRKPNPWGIHDMHGNVAEWVLTREQVKDHRKFSGKRKTTRAVSRETFRSMVLKGGSWRQDILACRWDARQLGSIDLWEEDPDLPQSPWWLASEMGLAIGFRIISPLDKHPPDVIEAYWGPDREDLAFDVKTRLQEARGALGLVDQRLPAIVRRLHEAKRKAAKRPPWAYRKN